MSFYMLIYIYIYIYILSDSVYFPCLSVCLTNTHKYFNIYIYIYIYACISVCVCMCMCVCVCVCVKNRIESVRIYVEKGMNGRKIYAWWLVYLCQRVSTLRFWPNSKTLYQNDFSFVWKTITGEIFLDSLGKLHQGQ